MMKLYSGPAQPVHRQGADRARREGRRVRAPTGGRSAAPAATAQLPEMLAINPKGRCRFDRRRPLDLRFDMYPRVPRDRNPDPPLFRGTSGAGRAAASSKRRRTRSRSKVFDLISEGFYSPIRRRATRTKVEKAREAIAVEYDRLVALAGRDSSAGSSPSPTSPNF